MKKLCMIALALAIAASFAACGCTRDMSNQTSDPTTTAPTTESAIAPDMTPTVETNIPDPSVDTEMPAYTEGTDNTTGTDMIDGATGKDANGK